MKTYIVNLLETFSQVLNAIHAGEPNTTFSARVASYRQVRTVPRYWAIMIFLFETFWPGHLDWAAQPDEG